MPNTKLTRRQYQFLESVVNTYSETGNPVSYKDVANKLEVSRWTAYDILQELYKKGFLISKYRPVGGPGRSEILYVPTQEAIERVEAGTIFAPVNAIGSFLSETQRKIEKLSIDSAINFVFERTKNETNAVLVLLYTVSLAVILTKVFGVNLNSMVNIQAVLKSKTYAPAILMFLVESIFSLLKDSNIEGNTKLEQDDKKKLETVLKHFRESAAQVSPSFQSKVLKYMDILV